MLTSTNRSKTLAKPGHSSQSYLPVTDLSLKNIKVIIPARDEAEAIAPVIQALQRTGLTRILVIDNGSQDNTTAIARQARADVIPEARPGYGQACWQGIQRLDPTIEWALFCDADGIDILSELV